MNAKSVVLGSSSSDTGHDVNHAEDATTVDTSSTYSVISCGKYDNQYGSEIGLAREAYITNPTDSTLNMPAILAEDTMLGTEGCAAASGYSCHTLYADTDGLDCLPSRQISHDVPATGISFDGLPRTASVNLDCNTILHTDPRSQTLGDCGKISEMGADSGNGNRLAPMKQKLVDVDDSGEDVKAGRSITLIERQMILTSLLAHSRGSAGAISHNFPSSRALEILIHDGLHSKPESGVVFLHEPTFQLASSPIELVLAVIAYGASLSNIQTYRQFGAVVVDAVILMIEKKWRNDKTTTGNTHLLQAWAFSLETLLWSGDEGKAQIGEGLLQPAITAMRRAGMFCPSNYTQIRPPAVYERSLLEAMWCLWLEQETRNRLVHHFFVHDAHMSMIQSANPLLSYAEMHLPQPEAEELWAARSAEDWTDSLCLNFCSGARGSVASCVRQLISPQLNLNAVTPAIRSKMTLVGIWGIIMEYRQAHGLFTTDNVQLGWHSFELSARYQLLSRALGCLLAEATALVENEQSSTKIPLEMHILQEHLGLALNTPFGEVYKFLGRFGDKEAEQACRLLHVWTENRDSRQGLWHAAQVLRYARRMSPEDRCRSFYAFVIHNASLVIWTFGTIIGEKKQPSECGSRLASHDFVQLDSASSRNVRRFIAHNWGVPVISQVPSRFCGAAVETDKWVQVTDTLSVINMADELLLAGHIFK